MTMLSRDWRCENRACAAAFHSYDRYPACPHCGNVRVTWVPGGGHVGNVKALDASLKALAKSYGMTDINSASPSRLNRSMPKHDPVVADGPVVNFAPGFAAPFNQAGRATCEPSRAHVDFKVRTSPEKQMTSQTGLPAIGASNWKTMRRQFQK